MMDDAFIVCFFSSCDCYILKDILQNWSDEDVSLILGNLFAVVKRGNRVLVMETVLHTGSFAEERVRQRFLREMATNLLVQNLVYF